MPFPEDVNLERPIDALKVAFASFIAKLIVDADDIVDFSELQLMAKTFPDPLLERLGFVDADGVLTAAHRTAYAESLEVLPEQLGMEEKLELITVFHRTAWADGELLQAELLVLREAAEVLKIPLTLLSEHLEAQRRAAESKG